MLAAPLRGAVMMGGIRTEGDGHPSDKDPSLGTRTWGTPILIMLSTDPTLAAKTTTRRGWGTHSCPIPRLGAIKLRRTWGTQI